jgi:hypothetical protein
MRWALSRVSERETLVDVALDRKRRSTMEGTVGDLGQAPHATTAIAIWWPRTGFGSRLMTVTGWHARKGFYQPLRSGAWTPDVKPGGTLTCMPYYVGEEKRQYLVPSPLRWCRSTPGTTKIALASNRSLHSSKAPFTRKRSYGPVHLCHEAQTRREIRVPDRLCSSVLMLTRRHRPSTRTRRHCGHGNIIIGQQHQNVPHSSQLRGERRRSIVHCHCCHCGGAAALLLRMSLDSPAVKLFTELG